MTSKAQSRTVRVLALSTGQSLATLAALLAAVVLARILSVRDYATYRQTFLAYQFAAPLLTLGLPMALYYFLPGEDRRRRGVLFDNLTALTVMGCVFAVFLLAGGNRLLAWRFRNPDLVGALRWMAVYALFALPAGALGACLTVQNRVVQLSVFNVLSRALTLVAIVVTVLFWPNPFAAVKANVVCEGLVLVLALWLMTRSVPRDAAGVSLRGMCAMAGYAVPLGLASMFGTLTLQLDKLIVASLCGPEDFAVYANGAMEIPLIGVVTGAMASVILVDMRAAVVKGDHEEALRLFRLAAARSACILLPAMCFLFVFAEDIVTVLFSNKYVGSVLPFRIYLLLLPVRAAFYGPALMALGQTTLVLVRSILDLCIDAVLSVLLVRYMGALGAAVATVAMLYLWCVPFNLVCIAKGYRTRFLRPLPWRRMAGVFLAALAAAVASGTVLALGAVPPALRVLLGFLLFATLYTGVGYVFPTEIRVVANEIIGHLHVRGSPRKAWS
jgi:O-antigen/teichoic acid export membrane protein